MCCSRVRLRRRGDGGDGKIFLVLTTMSALAMETHQFIKELTSAGLTERQAEVIAHHQAKIINDNLATKHDILLVRQDMELLEKKLIIKIGAMMIASFIFTIGLMLTLLPLLLN